VFIAHDERRRDLPLDRPPDLLDGTPIRRVGRNMHETNVVAGGVLPDESRVMGVEVIEDDDESFVRIRSPIGVTHFLISTERSIYNNSRINIRGPPFADL